MTLLYREEGLASPNSMGTGSLHQLAEQSGQNWILVDDTCIRGRGMLPSCEAFAAISVVIWVLGQWPMYKGEGNPLLEPAIALACTSAWSELVQWLTQP